MAKGEQIAIRVPLGTRDRVNRVLEKLAERDDLEAVASGGLNPGHVLRLALERGLSQLEDETSGKGEQT